MMLRLPTVRLQNKGGMFVLSNAQAKTLMGEAMRGKGRVLLDVGAGDGGVTVRAVIIAD